MAANLKRLVDDRLFALDHFPRQDALVLAEVFSSEESHSNYSAPLWGGAPVTPWTRPVSWLKGFACPWKGAWAMRTAGFAGGAFWLVCDWIITKSGLTWLARKIVS